MAVAWIPSGPEYFSTTSGGISVPLRCAAIAAKLADDEDLVGRRLLLGKLLDAARGGYLAHLFGVKPDVGAVFSSLVDAVEALDPETPVFTGFADIAASARALRDAASKPGRVHGSCERLEIVVDLAELAAADTEDAAAEAGYRFAFRWAGGDHGERGLRGFLVAHPLA